MSIPVLNTVRVTQIKDITGKLVKAHFANSLGLEPDIVNIINALVKKESGFISNSLGKPVGTGKGSMGANYMNSSAVQAVLRSSSVTEIQKNNIDNGLRAVGLMQIMGYNFVRKATSTGVCELERVRPDLAPQLVVEPGEDMITPILGDTNMDKAILAGLIMLEGKYRAVQPLQVSQKLRGYTVKGDPYRRVFSTKLSGAIAAYIGLGKADLNGTTPEAYSASIVGGDVYIAANGKASYKIYDWSMNVVSTNGPATNGINQDKIGSPGCTKA
jgi:hypothetical protein